jgi:predicted RNA polymerase sigma factor
VTRNLCLNHLSRYRARWRFFSEFSLEQKEDDREIDFAAPDTFEQDLETKDNRRLLEVALQKLPATQRVPLVLYHFEDLGYEEIAAKLRISLGKVKTDIFRGREALRKKLRMEFENPALDGEPRALGPSPRGIRLPFRVNKRHRYGQRSRTKTCRTNYRELRQLPPLKAPEALVARVFTAIN